MFRITEDPSPGSLVQYLAKITKNDSIVSLLDSEPHTHTHIGLQYVYVTITHHVHIR